MLKIFLTIRTQSKKEIKKMDTKTIEEIKEQVAFVLYEYHEKNGRYFYNDTEVVEIIESAFLYGGKSATDADIDIYEEEDQTTVEIKHNFAVLIVEYNKKWEEVHVKLTGEYTFEAYKNGNGEFFDGMILE